MQVGDDERYHAGTSDALERIGMTENTIVQMTQDEFKEMLKSVVEETVERKLLEILGDPDDGLEVRSEVRERLLRQRQEGMGGERGRPFEDVVRELGLE